MIEAVFAALVGLAVSQAPAPATPLNTQIVSPRISGVVIDATTGKPVRRARVQASAVSGSGKGEAVSGQDGRFEIHDLLAGHYTLTASKGGYLPAEYGQVRVGGPGLAVAVPGEEALNVSIRISSGGVIQGRVLDENGEPVILAHVRALQPRFDRGARWLASTPIDGASTQTDDRGLFRLYGLPPGEYYLEARPLAPFAMATARLPPSEVRMPGTTFFPNSVDPAAARPIKVAADVEAAPVTITLTATRPGRIAGRAVRSTGEPFAYAFATLTPRDDTGLLTKSLTVVREDGTFDLPGVPPGTYQLTVRGRAETIPPDDEFGHALVTLAADDIHDLIIVAGRPGAARGRIVSDEPGGTLPLKPQDITLSTVQAADDDRLWRASGPARIKDDFSFELEGLLGLHAFTADIPNHPEWRLKSLWLRGNDVTDQGVDVASNGSVEGLTVVLTRAANDVSGVAVDAEGRRTADAWVILFPDDESLWRWPSRWVRAVQPDAQGKFRMSRLPSSSGYLIAAVPYQPVDPRRWADADVLTALRSLAAPLSMTSSELGTITVKVRQR